MEKQNLADTSPANYRTGRRPLFDHLLFPSSEVFSAWLRGSGWVIGSSIIERAVALAQTILIARTIGIEDYGLYALFFSTVGFLIPLANFQLGYAVIVNLARYGEKDPVRAAGVLLMAETITNFSVLVLLVPSLIFAAPLAEYLFGDPQYGTLIMLGGVLTLLFTKIGLYDCVLQASEHFRLLARSRILSSLATFAIVASAAWIGVGLTGVVMAIVVGATIRLLLVLFQALKIGRGLKGGVTIRQGLSHVGLLISFSLPTAMISLGLGYAMWFGNYTLSQMKGGLGELAVLNTAVQWRSPVLIVSEALATALLPVLGRSLGKGDSVGVRHLHLSNLALNVCIGLGSCAGIILFAQPILSLYGDGFVREQQIFILFILPLVLIVYCQATQQKFVAAGRMWFLLCSYLPLFVIIVVGISFFGNQLNGVRLAYIHIIGWIAFSVALAIGSRFFFRDI